MIVFECWDDWKITGMCIWVLKCLYACMLSWSHACLFIGFIDNLLTFDFALMIKCSHNTFFKDHMLLCLTSLMFTHFDDRMLPSLCALMITCDLPVCHLSHLIGRFDDYLIKYSNALMIASSLVSMFTCLISTHECTHDDREMSIVLEA